VLYQCDLTLHTETCVNLGSAGHVASGAWLMIFGAELHGLAWAMRRRVSAAAWSTRATSAARGADSRPWDTFPARSSYAVVMPL
jgi:hypothetical protein